VSAASEQIDPRLRAPVRAAVADLWLSTERSVHAIAALAHRGHASSSREAYAAARASTGVKR
jgi:hypothetical protein